VKLYACEGVLAMEIAVAVVCASCPVYRGEQVGFLSVVTFLEVVYER
jgi:hypothetical protein